MLFLVIIPCILLFVYAWRRQRKYLQGKLPPVCGFSWPIVGLAHLWANGSLWKRLLDIQKDCLDRGGITLLFSGVNPSYTYYALCDPVDTMTIADSVFEKAYLLEDPVKELLGNGLVMTPSWQKRRDILEPIFEQLCVQLEAVNEQSIILAKEIAASIGDESFDCTSCIRRAVMKLMYAATFGGNDSEDCRKRVNLFNQTTEDTTSMLYSIHRNVFMHNKVLYGLSKLKRRYREGTMALTDMTNEIIKTKKAASKYKLDNNDEPTTTEATSKSLADHLLELEERGVYPEENMVKELITMMFSGYATISNTVLFCLHLLGSHIEVQHKTQKETYHIFENKRAVGVDDLKELEYLEAVLMETLRLYPPVSMVTRIVDKEVQLRKYKLEAGSKCLLGIYGMNRHAVWGDDKQQFKPERWLDSTCKKASFASFGFGKRSCIGKQLSLNILKVILVHILRQFDVASNGTEIKLKQELFLAPASHNFIFRIREHKAENIV